MKKLLLLALLIMVVSCDSDDDTLEPQNCTDIYIYGLKVTVKDNSNDLIVTDGLTLTATEGSYVEELMRIENSDFFVGAGERKGTYTIEIASNEYQSYISDAVEVKRTEDDCHVITEELEFYLESN